MASSLESAVPTRSWRVWALWGEPRGLIAYLLALELFALAGTAFESTSFHLSEQAAGRSLLLLALAVFFEEATSHAGRMRLRLSEHLKPDMTSVWSFPAAIVLPAPYAIACVSALLCYMWVRQQRPGGELAYRKVGTAATILIACLTTGWALHFVETRHLAVPSGVAGALAIAVALVVYPVTNRALVTVALLLLGVRGRGLVGSWEDNLLELATLCLGGLAALAVRDDPWLALLLLLPMVLLQRGALTHQLEVAATTDSKTGLLNALAWDHLANRELARAQRESSSTALFIIDLDRFKTVNDVYGHLVGDAALRAVGHCLKNELRVYDVIGRFGGEEFVALLPGVIEAEAIDIAQRLRAVINEIRISDLTPIGDTASDSAIAGSIGVAWSPTDGWDLSELLHAADAALYVAKGAGRNRVELAWRGEGTATRPQLAEQDH